MDDAVLRVHVSYLDEIVLVSPEGDIDMDSAFVLRVGLEEIDSAAHVAIDMSGVRFMDSSGLNVLVEQLMRRRDSNGSLCIRNPSHGVRRLIDITSLAEFFYEPFDA